MGTSACRDGVDDDVAEIGVARGVEGAAAGDEAELRAGGGAVDGGGGKAVLGVEADRGGAVGTWDIGAVAGAQARQPVADGRAGQAVDVAGDDRRAGCAGPGAAVIPAGDGEAGGDLQGAGRGKAEADQRGADADRGYGQRGRAGGGADGGGPWDHGGLAARGSRPGS